MERVGGWRGKEWEGKKGKGMSYPQSNLEFEKRVIP